MKHKRFLIILGVLILIAMVFTAIAWVSVHPKDSLTLEEVQKYVQEKKLCKVEKVEDYYLAYILNEGTVEEGDSLPESQLLSDTHVCRILVLKEQDMEEAMADWEAFYEIWYEEVPVSYPVIFAVNLFQLLVFGAVAGFLWKLAGGVNRLKRKPKR